MMYAYVCVTRRSLQNDTLGLGPVSEWNKRHDVAFEFACPLSALSRASAAASAN